MPLDGGNSREEPLELLNMMTTERLASLLIDSQADLIETMTEFRSRDLYPPKEIVGEQFIRIAAYAVISYAQLYQTDYAIDRLGQYLYDLMTQEMRNL